LSKGKLLAVSAVWLVIFGLLAVSWKLFVQPWRAQRAEDAQRATVASTSSDSQYRATIRLALDSFSGYAILRSPKFKDELAKYRLRVETVDDGADYGKRIDGLARGEFQLAAFTIDALVHVLAERNDQPATIVALIDESRGADAVLANRDIFPDIDAMNHPETRFVLTADSPSETLARVMMDRFHLDELSDTPFTPLADPAAIMKHYRASKPTDRNVYVLWEPYVSEVLKNDKMVRLMDSTASTGKIVDCLVVSRDFLVKNEPIVQDFLSAYFRAAYYYRDTMPQLIAADSQELGTPLSESQTAGLVKGIWWKNTQENYAHMGLRHGSSLQLLEDMIASITQVLVRTKAISADPTGGQPVSLYYDKVLGTMHAADFHPGSTEETLRDDQVELPALTEQQWSELNTVGTVAIQPLVFARGRYDLTESSKATLDELAFDLKTWPRYYLMVQGNAGRQGNLEANKALAVARAKAAEEYLIDAGVAASRVRAIAVEPSGQMSVTFKLGEMPY
jgi:outer membrane protein OmpA-like peptidoglycan-associated protein/ABC-type nitrate/sulfonate/bicarbonate transport system substrate-binding protein